MIQRTDKSFAPTVQDRIDNLNKPKGSLGRLETLALQVALVQHTLTPRLVHPCHRESESKNRYAYSAVPVAERVLSLLLGMFPLVLCVAVGWSSLPRWESWMSGLSACAVLLFVLYRTMYRRIGGYTGDCCGATMLLAELVSYFILLIVP